MKESEVFEHIKEALLFMQSKKDKPVRVAINGIEGTGKTVFAEKLTRYLNAQHFKAIQVTIDGFHFDKAIRYQQGRDSAKGYYENAYNELDFVEKVLKASQSETPNYTEATHDLETDKYVHLDPVFIDFDTVLITDGAYLFKPNYRHHWDLKIYLKTSFETALIRGIERDKTKLGGYDSTKEKFKQRYHKASEMYLEENKPEQIADIIIDNTDFEDLILKKNRFAL